MSAVGITENAKGDNKKFEIWCNSREEVYIVQVHICRCFFLMNTKKTKDPSTEEADCIQTNVSSSSQWQVLSSLP